MESADTSASKVGGKMSSWTYLSLIFMGFRYMEAGVFWYWRRRLESLSIFVGLLG
jgi:hypothetical protein